MYKLTVCGVCGSEIMQEGCCGNETIIYQCPCGEKYLEKIADNNKKKSDQRNNLKEGKKCHS